jgi:hypothetical protein
MILKWQGTEPLAIRANVNIVGKEIHYNAVILIQFKILKFFSDTQSDIWFRNPARQVINHIFILERV